MLHNVEALLSSAGWSPDRRVDASAYIDELRAEGYQITQRLAEIIANVAGISICFVRGGRPDVINIDPRLAVRQHDSAWTQDYSRRVGAMLTPMGFSNHEHLLLLVDDDGRWYGGYDNEFGFIGTSLSGLVDAIANNRGFRDQPAHDEML